jgi:hypothetical protein
MKALGYGFRSYTKKFMLTKKMIKARLSWCKMHRNWKEREWNLVLFSDESTIELNMDRKQYVIRKIGEKYNLNCVRKLIKHPVKVMFWTFITSRGVGPLIACEGMMNSKKYIDTLENHLFPHIHKFFKRNEKWIFEHDSAPCHKSKISTEYLDKKKARVLPWCGNSPDLAAIENVFCVWKEEVAKLKPSNRTELISVAKFVWENNERVKSTAINCIASMPRRVAACIAAKGGPTKY